jgi:hypothetical protein
VPREARGFTEGGRIRHLPRSSGTDSRYPMWIRYWSGLRLWSREKKIAAASFSSSSSLSSFSFSLLPTCEIAKRERRERREKEREKGGKYGWRSANFFYFSPVWFIVTDTPQSIQTGDIHFKYTTGTADMPVKDWGWTYFQSKRKRTE